MNQLSMNLEPRARNADPETSHAAASKASAFAVTHRTRIMVAFNAPSTPRELATRSGIDYVAVQRRMKELQELGLAEPTEDRRDGCRVWRRL